ncbi:MAG: YebC/PmpR family DNA-binding transcriptional regulator [Patescibacteria group bacterium]|jgi:YebC/PmpR family DNA-binding regulatory protein
MSGHSHSHNIQDVKGKADAIRANTFSKVAKNITVSVKEGGTDPSFNFKLRMAIDAAKAVNMPKDNIERAVARGAGGGEGASIDEVIYEGFAPGGVALLIRCTTDNRNRTVGEIKNIVSKNGGSVGGQGSVMWMFDKKGVVSFVDSSAVGDRETFEMAMIEAGAEDIISSGEGLQVICDVKDLKKVVDAAEALKLKPDGVGIEFLAKTTTKVDDPAVQKQIEEFIETVEENDDVDAVFTNEA